MSYGRINSAPLRGVDD